MSKNIEIEGIILEIHLLGQNVFDTFAVASYTGVTIKMNL